MKGSETMANRFVIRRITSRSACFACMVTTACIIVISMGTSEDCSREDLFMYKKQLSSVSLQLKALSERHKQLIVLAKRVNINTKGFESPSSFVNDRDPPINYEIKRRIIYSNIKDLWNYVKDTFGKLVEDQTVKIKKINTVQKIQAMLDQIRERKRCLLSDIDSLPVADGYDEWRRKEASEVSDLIQRKLQYLQNPGDCKAAKKVQCDIPNDCGFGCQLHYLVFCLVFAYATERTVIVQSTLWQYHSKGWGHIFEPLSNSCISIYDERVFPWHSIEAKVVMLPKLDSIEKQRRPIFLPPAVPKDLAERIIRFNGDPASWWVGQLVKFLFRPRDTTQDAMKPFMDKINWRTPVVGLQIRGSDKVIKKEAAQRDLHEYMVHVKDYYDRLELTQNVDVRRVYLASDDPKLLKEARERYTLYEFLGNESIAELAGDSRRFSPQALLGVLVDLQLLARSDLLVCTLSSNFGRVAYAMMQANRADASNAVVSLDDVYHFWGTDRTRVSLIPHYPSADSTNEIHIMPDDVINETSNLWNVYGFGTNTRTNSSGLFPWFKTDENLVLYPFPEYKAVDEF